MLENKATQLKEVALEAILFTYGEPLSRKKLCDLLGATPDILQALCVSLRQRLAEGKSGLMLGESDERLTLLTTPANGEFVEKLFKTEFSEELSSAGEETLAIVAYAGPISRAEVEYIRGVNSSFTIRNLLIRGLVERETGSSAIMGYRYHLSFDAVKHLGLSKVEELPEYAKFHSLIDEFRQKNAPDGKENPLV